MKQRPVFQVYSNPERVADPHALPNVEVFFFPGNAVEDRGWYWWPCFPGCLPDGEPTGPFNSYAEAIANAQEDSDDRG